MSEQRYPMAPLIRFTLVSLYFALVFPLPWLAPSNLQPWLIGALPVGFLLVWALVSEEVSLNEAGLQVGYPRWCSWLLRRGWSLNWDQVKGLTPVATSQGGLIRPMERVSRPVFWLNWPRNPSKACTRWGSR